MKFNLDDYMKNLETIVNIESGSNYIEGISKVADFFEDKFHELKFNIERIDLKTGPLLRMKSNNEPTNDLLLIGHMDTVFPKGTIEDWPFTKDEEKAYGPGVIDMKSGLLTIYEIIRNLDDDFLKNYNICILMNPDEEISSIESKKYIIEEAKRSKYAFIFEPSRVNGAMVKQRKGLAKYKLKFKGRAAHAGVDPQNGRSAILAMSRVIIDINELVDLEAGISLNFGIVKGGTGANVVAENAETLLDLRYIKDSQIEEVEKRLEKWITNLRSEGITLEIEKPGERPPMNPSEKSLELIDLFTEVAKTESIDINWVGTGGGSDGNFTSYYGVPTIDAIGPIGGGGHSHREYLEYHTVEGRVKIITKLILQMAEKKMI